MMRRPVISPFSGLSLPPLSHQSRRSPTPSPYRAWTLHRLRPPRNPSSYSPIRRPSHRRLRSSSWLHRGYSSQEFQLTQTSCLPAWCRVLSSFPSKSSQRSGVHPQVPGSSARRRIQRYFSRCAGRLLPLVATLLHRLSRGLPCSRNARPGIAPCARRQTVCLVRKLLVPTVASWNSQSLAEHFRPTCRPYVRASADPPSSACKCRPHLSLRHGR